MTSTTIGDRIQCITIEEIQRLLKKVKKKTVNLQVLEVQVAVELLKKAPLVVFETSASLYKKCLINGEIPPEEWN